jgi:hypothetical protein
MAILQNSLESSYFRISEYVLTEIKNDEIEDMIKKNYKKSIVVDSEKTQLIVKELQSKYPSVINPRNPNRNRGDFFVIAMAKEHNLRVLTMEKKVRNIEKSSVLNKWPSHAFKKIPQICLKESIECLDLTELMAELMARNSA